MRILTLSNCPLVATQGSGYVILGYVGELRRRGNDIDLVGPRELETPRGGPRAIRYRQMLGMAMIALRKASSYDLLEFYGGESWLAIELLRRRGRRPLLVAHSNGLEPHATRRLAQLGPRIPAYQLDLSGLYSRAFRGADGLVMVSEFDRAFALEEGYLAPERMLVIENPLPSSYLGQPLDLERPKRLLHCGGWIGIKGVRDLAAGTAAFLESRPDWRLVLAGVGEGFRLADHFPAEVLHQIEVRGALDRETGLRQLYSRCRIAIQASVYESFGLATAEALASGCALVSTAVGLAAALRDEAEVLWVPPASPEGITLALHRLADDEALRRQIASGGYQRVQRLAWREAGASLESAYSSWLAEHSRGGRS
jgi:glycosyltransferase involved in cell wall biosynthesis